MSAIKPHFTAAKRAGDYIFVSGQLPFDQDMKIVNGGIEIQTRVVINHIAQALEHIGSDLSHVVKTMVWLTNPDDFPAFNASYAEFFQENPPARATVGSTLMVTGALIEIEAIAFHPLQPATKAAAE
jgi:2-iminobutanoate/2-iminopropanoate deaminase